MLFSNLIFSSNMAKSKDSHEALESTSLPVFLSCGTPHTEVQESFLSAVEAYLKSHGCEPQTVGRSKFSARQPVEASRDLIASCNGAVVIAFERTRILTGLDKPGSSSQKKIEDESYPTVWNQMEAAMAYANKVPILTLIEPNLKRQGMLSDRLEWMAMEVEFLPAFLATEHFRQVFTEWFSEVKRTAANPEPLDFDPGEMKVSDLLPLLKGKQAWAIAAGIFSILAVLATAAFKAGQFIGQ
jgi:hypothetical protein